MKVIAQNRRARFDYQIVDTLEAGIQLTGQEVKSCRQGHINLMGSYVSFLKGRPILKSATIAKYTFAASVADYDPMRDRPLLLSKKDIARLDAAAAEKGVTIIPIEVRAGKFIKVVLGIGKGKKRIDKRQTIKDRDVSRRLKKGQDY